MNFASLPADWPTQRETLRRVATHVVARAQQSVTGHFALMALPGGFGTPQFGPERRRVRVVGGSLFVEQIVDGSATTTVSTIAGSTLSSLCAAAGTNADPGLSVGHDTPPLGDPDEMIMLDSDAVSILDDWYQLGHRAIDTAISSQFDPQAGVLRLWPEHFDLGTDLAIDPARRPGARTNLGASPGDDSHEEPYLYVGPWDDARPGPPEFWNRPFGAVLSWGELDAADNPLQTAIEFFLTGLAHLRS
ncbi:MAG: hypothetical protein AAF945_13090 [Actinomycetota bacterium]